MNIRKILLIILLLVILCTAISLFIAFGGLNFLIPVPKPVITYGEFPCRLTYELNGKEKVIEDVIVCEFEGFEFKSEAGKYKKWKTYLKSGKTEMTLLDLSDLNEKNEFGHTILGFFFSYGNAEYYMGDTERHSIPQISDYIEYKYKTQDGIIGGSAYKADEAWEKYKIRLISWEVSPPIQNSFK